MAQLSRDDVLKLARLARIDVSEAEIDEYASEFSEILEYVAQLNGVAVDGLRPTSQVTGLTNVTRPDEIRDYGYTADDLLKNVPQTRDHQIQVRRVLE